MAGGEESEVSSARASSEGEKRLTGLMTADSVVGDLQSVLAKYPSVRLSDGRNINRAAAEWLQSVGVDDVDPDRVVRSELNAILSEPLTGKGELLAAGWLLRMRPAHDLRQAEADLGGQSVGVPTVAARVVAEQFERKNASAFRHVAALCLELWSEEWAAQKLAEPRTAFQTSKTTHSPRTRAVARVLAEALDRRFEQLASSPSTLRQRRKLWKGEVPPSRPDPEARKWARKIAHLSWATTRRRVVTLVSAGLAVTGASVMVVAASAATTQSPLISTEVLVYRPSLPATPPEASGSRYQDLTCMESNTSPRRDARLCVTVNFGPVWDPCFEIDEHYVSCPAPVIPGQGRDSFGVVESVRPVIQNVGRQNYPADRQISIDEAVEQSRPWAIALKEPVGDDKQVCFAKYDDVLGPLPVRFACVKWETRYALDIDAIIDGTDQGTTLNFTGDSSVVFDLDRSAAVWKVRASGGSEGVYREVEVAAAYF